jgi:hypothetical protein
MFFFAKNGKQRKENNKPMKTMDKIENKAHK